MEGIGPDQAGKEELKRAETWRAIRRELSLGVKPQWTGKSTSNTRLFKQGVARAEARAKNSSTPTSATGSAPRRYAK